jgi:hypothetical protein
MNRRLFLWSGAGLALSQAVLNKSPAASLVTGSEMAYRFASGDCEVRMTVEFKDNYSTQGFWFKDQLAQRRFCYSGAGQENRSCLPSFTGAIAIAQYHVRSSSRLPIGFTLRERVRTIDQDERLSLRAPFESTIELEDGVASDIQAFGYPSEPSSASRDAEISSPWCVLRQDLYLPGADSVFLVIHWKHTLNAIRIFDIIPGRTTRVIQAPDESRRK